MVRGVSLWLVASACALVLAGGAHAGPGLLVGVDDDAVKWTDPATLLPLYADLGVDAVRVTLDWQPRQTAPRADALPNVGEAALAARVVLEVGGGPRSHPPLTAAARDRYCGYVAAALRDHPAIADVVIWTEANQPTFWPRPSAPAYVALLARCWDVLHEEFPDVNVIASTGPHARVRGAVAPARWYALLGDALRQSGRRARIVDTFGHNVYPDTPREPPWKQHRGPSIDEGDYATLVSALRRSFRGTGQPGAGRAGVTIWYLEDGYQSSVRGREELYARRENVRELLSPVEQGRQLAAAVRLAYCQPFVGAFFNFQLADDASLVGWQSGVLWPDLTPKPAWQPFADAIADVAAGTVACS